MRFLAFIVFVFSASAAFADEKKYGSLTLRDDLPNTLFVTSELKSGDGFELRKALRNHSIDTIVLASPGGLVWEGLQMAGVIFDKKLRTYIPDGAVCASACSFLFFAGNERLSDGRLGVHQAYSSDASKKQPVGETQYATQFTVSEIIGFLNEFGTPAFVYERMFQDVEMYFFDASELRQINSTEFRMTALEKAKISLVTSLLLEKSDEDIEERSIEQKEPKLTKTEQRDLIILIQRKLRAIGCNPGPADGIWGRKTEAAAKVFAKKAGLPTEKNSLITRKFLTELASAPANFCPKPQPVFRLSFARQYDVYCDGKINFNSPFNVTYDRKNKRIFTEDKFGNSISGFYSGPVVNMGGIFLHLQTTSAGFVNRMTWTNPVCKALVAIPR